MNKFEIAKTNEEILDSFEKITNLLNNHLLKFTNIDKNKLIKISKIHNKKETLIGIQ